MKNKAAAPYSRVTDKGVTVHTKMGKPLSSCQKKETSLSEWGDFEVEIWSYGL